MRMTNLTTLCPLFIAACASQTGVPATATSLPPPPPKPEHEEQGPRPKHLPASTPWTRPVLTLSEEIPLSSDKGSSPHAQLSAKGGAFTHAGWQAAERLDMLTIALARGFGASEAGAIELEMTNLDFDAQVNGKKQHFFSLYAKPSGDQFDKPNHFFTLRGGDYRDKGGQRGIKVLWRGGGIRGEAAPFGTRPRWDPKATHVWRAEWTATELAVFLDGERIFGPAEFANRDPALPLRYVFLSKDGIKKESVWYGFPGPVYQRLRVYRAAKPPGRSASARLVLQAIQHFPYLTVDGFSPTRIEKEKNVVSVDADKSGYAFGMAETRFEGEDGVYDVTLTTVQDGDGVCEYFVRAGGVQTSRFVQTGARNGQPELHTWKGVRLRNGDRLGVAGNGSDSRQNAPGKGPKGFHMAHGRWSKLELSRTGPLPAAARK